MMEKREERLKRLHEKMKENDKRIAEDRLQRFLKHVLQAVLSED